MEATITLKLLEIIGLIGMIAVPLCAVVVFLHKRGEAKNTTIVNLTKSFIDSNNHLSKALENNTRVIEKLPETIMLHINAKK